LLLQDRVVLPAVEAMERELEEHDIKIENRISETLALHADVNLLRIVYDNLLSNAVKYGRAGGVILLDAQESADQVTLSVRNDGEGIPPDKMGRLFRKFSRLDSPESTGKRGTGLGLYISREIVEKHDGEMWAESQVGEWARFSFTIPK
jgi:signal transduction histidine kinase